jgi:hypothetical protein
LEETVEIEAVVGAVSADLMVEVTTVRDAWRIVAMIEGEVAVISVLKKVY